MKKQIELTILNCQRRAYFQGYRPWEEAMDGYGGKGGDTDGNEGSGDVDVMAMGCGGLGLGLGLDLN